MRDCNAQTRKIATRGSSCTIHRTRRLISTPPTPQSTPVPVQPGAVSFMVPRLRRTVFSLSFQRLTHSFQTQKSPYCACSLMTSLSTRCSFLLRLGTINHTRVSLMVGRVGASPARQQSTPATQRPPLHQRQHVVRQRKQAPATGKR